MNDHRKEIFHDLYTRRRPSKCLGGVANDPTNIDMEPTLALARSFHGGGG